MLNDINFTVSDMTIPDELFQRRKNKNNRHMRLYELLHQHSWNATLVVMWVFQSINSWFELSLHDFSSISWNSIGRCPCWKRTCVLLLCLWLGSRCWLRTCLPSWSFVATKHPFSRFIPDFHEKSVCPIFHRVFTNNNKIRNWWSINVRTEFSQATMFSHSDMRYI
jgi:hypothetical protein